METPGRSALPQRGDPYFPFGYPVSRAAWEELALGDLLYRGEEPRHVWEIQTARATAARLNDSRSGEEAPFISPGHLLALGLIEEILRYLIDHYTVEEQPRSFAEGVEWAENTARARLEEATLPVFLELFPPLPVLAGTESGSAFISRAKGPLPNRLVAVREMALLLLSMGNPAMRPFQRLFDDADLRARTPYTILVERLETFFQTKPPLAKLGLRLFEALRAPVTASPYSLDGQLDYILRHWAELLPEILRVRLLLSRDVLREETKPRGFGPGPATVLTFGKGPEEGVGFYPEFERFSPDRDWMSNVVMIAKSTFVWLDQLSRKYSREIHRLDQIPEEELERLARWGFNSLWLIGVWERSHASRAIKRMRGNPEALASAYSLHDYEIAADLGGEAAYLDLKGRALRWGIRLASDMVPNHMGLDSRWVIEHPEWFIQVPHPPFPNNRFTGADLSRDGRVGVFLEDGYWDHSDAAVVFKRLDRWTRESRYIYHGNDGTHMPWNDTAQLNYLLPEVREAVIQTILHVARMFSIIRFDAAMTLTKRHYQRLWFPPPGHGGDIPSRSEHGLSRAAFDAAMPEEFWREVVDRVAAEVPETLLLAEAFWLMEGYFVRTLGMHRVYNSAFMNMLKDEDNAKYRETLKNVLEFSPEVLKRFVNFMNNPDEKTAVEQFGKGDKYFGICMMMATLPGLPMFGHGQIEGFAEKYGMEYRRAYWNETEDGELLHRHEAEIFPLLRRRFLFSGVENFALYDFHAPEGHVNENVFAYSNRVDADRAIILYNNSYHTTSGWIRESTAINMGRQEETQLVRRTLTEALGIGAEETRFLIFQDHAEGLEYLRSAKELAEKGLFVHLRGYQYHAFVDFREVIDSDGSWGRLAGRLEGKGVPDMELARRELELAPILEPLRALLLPHLVRGLSDPPLEEDRRDSLEQEARAGIARLCDAAKVRGLKPPPPLSIWKTLERDLNGLELLESLKERESLSADVRDRLEELIPGGDPERTRALSFHGLFTILRAIEPVFRTKGAKREKPDWIGDWVAWPSIDRALMSLDGPAHRLGWDSQLQRALLQTSDLFSGADQSLPLEWLALAANRAASDYLLLHEYDGVLWINKERLETFLDHLFAVNSLTRLTGKTRVTRPLLDKIEEVHRSTRRLAAVAAEAGYRVDRMIAILSPPSETGKKPRARRAAKARSA
ncbi:MAG: hypothetical protein GHCLOJNM_03189 [bacterium]|nr:hypothetical protein [bacterium]